MPFAAVWLYLVVTSFVMTEEDAFPDRIDPMLILFVAIGLYFLIGRFTHEALQRHYSYYAVTDQRVIVKSGLFSSQLQSTWLNSIVSIQLNKKRNGQGSLKFETVGSRTNKSLFAKTSNAQTMPLRFEKIKGARQVYELITEAQSKRISA